MSAPQNTASVRSPSYSSGIAALRLPPVCEARALSPFAHGAAWLNCDTLPTRTGSPRGGPTRSRDQDMIEIRSGTENVLKAALEVLKEKMVRREVPLKALREGPVLPAARSTYRQNIHINRGISDDKARELSKFIKGTGVK